MAQPQAANTADPAPAPDPAEEERREFLCNVSLVKALYQFLPIGDRKKIQDWVVKLQAIADGTEETKMRNEYIGYLLIKMQNGILTQPFNRPPPPGQLQPLSNVLPSAVYEDVQKQLKISFCRTNRMLNAGGDNYETPDVRCEPSSFHSEQPRPLRGITASFAVFSNYDDGGS